MQPIFHLCRAWFRSSWLAGLGTALALVCHLHLTAMTATPGGNLPVPLFPADNWWNVDVSTWPVDPGSGAFIEFVNNGSVRRLHPDLGGDAGSSDDPNATYGMPYVVVSNVASTDLVPVEFDYADESDGVTHGPETSYPFYPIPQQAIGQPHWIEGGDPGSVDLRSSEDRHLLIVDYDRKYLYELYNVFFDASERKWYAGSGAFFDLNTNARRPEGWTSADAAGLAILPGLVRYDEIYDSAEAEIGHAFRVTVRATNGSVYPASHRAGSRAGALPMGARLRLKSSINVSDRIKDPKLQRIFRAMQKHGLIVADNGSDMFITGTYDLRWDSDQINPAFRAFSASDFEVLQLGFKPSAASSTIRVNNVRARLEKGLVTLTWEPSTASTQYRIETTDTLDSAAPWAVAGQTTRPSWQEDITSANRARFYRVTALAP